MSVPSAALSAPGSLGFVVEKRMTLVREYRALHTWIASCSSHLRDGLINASCAVFISIFADLVSRRARPSCAAPVTLLAQTALMESLTGASEVVRLKLWDRVRSSFVSAAAGFVTIAPGLLAELQLSFRLGKVRCCICAQSAARARFRWPLLHPTRLHAVLADDRRARRRERPPRGPSHP